MNWFDVFAPYFDGVQKWHVFFGLGFVGFLAFWQVEKWKIDRETENIRFFEDEVRKDEERKKKEKDKSQR
jgi:hypothetical protein